MLDLKQLRDVDPLKRVVEKETGQAEFSPMAPPDAYAPPALEDVPYEAMHPFLQGLMDDHKKMISALEAFEGVLLPLREEPVNRSTLEGLTAFFRFLDEQIVPHQRKEEKLLFPIMHERLLEKGEHSRGPVPRTAIDLLEDDHVKVMQMAALSFNFFGLASRLPDPASRALVLQTALEQGQALVELLRLHLFREEHVVFPLAHVHLTPGELDALARRLTSLP